MDEILDIATAVAAAEDESLAERPAQGRPDLPNDPEPPGTCLLCKGPHRLYNCPRRKDPDPWKT